MIALADVNSYAAIGSLRNMNANLSAGVLEGKNLIRQSWKLKEKFSIFLPNRQKSGRKKEVSLFLRNCESSWKVVLSPDIKVAKKFFFLNTATLWSSDFRNNEIDDNFILNE